ncbi:dolichyl-diphosphooligosaccharide-protein glycotransferase [Apiospora rasikravindrae]|uniref:Dolichyl-diphosphooligosaccharide-protein glycotransferase n=1 Tax=Apiospora rasikravindrae TaxID=990691 RepID=A0ABR1UC46_9PEZI
MRWLPVFISLALPFGTLAAKKPSSPADTFNDFHAKAISNTPVKLADSSYKKLTASPRDYSVTVLLTAMDPRFGCQLCREFQPEWDLLAKSWLKGDKKAESRIIFSTLDFSDGRDTFISVCSLFKPSIVRLGTNTIILVEPPNRTSAAVLPPTIGPHAVPGVEGPIRFDFTNGPLLADQVHAWLSRHLPDRPHPAVKRPVNYVAWAVGVVSTLGIAGALAKAGPYILPIAQNRNAWAAISLIGILMFTSGHMFNQIRKVPYVAGDGRGGISYFSSGFQNQLGMETQIIAFIYGLLSFSAIALIMKVPRVADAKKQQVWVLLWSAILFLLYSFLLSIFRIKNGGYPFSLPPFM